jgi:hypothetical protein
MAGAGTRPSRPPVGPVQSRVDIVHHTSAVLFFASLAYIAVFLFMKPEAPLAQLRRRLAEVIPPAWWLTWLQALLWSSDDIRTTRLTDGKKTRNTVYGACGIAIAIGLVLLVAINTVLSPSPPTMTFWLQTLALCSFAVAWLVKGEMVLTDRQLEGVRPDSADQEHHTVVADAPSVGPRRTGQPSRQQSPAHRQRRRVDVAKAKSTSR